VVSPLAAVPVLAAAISPGGLVTFAAIRLVSSRVRLIARQAVRRGDYVGNRRKSGRAQLAPETTFMTHFDVGVWDLLRCDEATSGTRV
jgi:hypothetical protein